MLSLPDKELCLREALAVCTPPAPERQGSQVSMRVARGSASRLSSHAIPVFWHGESPWTEEPGGLQSIGHKDSDTTELNCIKLTLFFLHTTWRAWKPSRAGAFWAQTEDPSGCGAASPSQGRWDP